MPGSRQGRVYMFAAFAAATAFAAPGTAAQDSPFSLNEQGVYCGEVKNVRQFFQERKGEVVAQGITDQEEVIEFIVGPDKGWVVLNTTMTNTEKGDETCLEVLGNQFISNADYPQAGLNQFGFRGDLIEIPWCNRDGNYKVSKEIDFGRPSIVARVGHGTGVVHVFKNATDKWVLTLSFPRKAAPIMTDKGVIQGTELVSCVGMVGHNWNGQVPKDAGVPRGVRALRQDI